MQEITDMRDEVSGLIISPLTKELIEKMLHYEDESDKETFEDFKARTLKAFEKSGLYYFLSRDGKLMCMSKSAKLKCQGEYFDDWEDAEDAYFKYHNDKGLDDDDIQDLLYVLKGVR